MTAPPPAVTGVMLIESVLAGQPGTVAEALHHLMLPVAVLAFVLSGPIIEMVRQKLARAQRSDFVREANAAGLPRARVAAHALGAAMAPSMTLIGILHGFMLTGAVLIETEFSLCGIGQYAVRSLPAFDDPAIRGVVLAITAVALLVHLALDLIHAAIDPRMSH